MPTTEKSRFPGDDREELKTQEPKRIESFGPDLRVSTSGSSVEIFYGTVMGELSARKEMRHWASGLPLSRKPALVLADIVKGVRMREEYGRRNWLGAGALNEAVGNFAEAIWVGNFVSAEPLQSKVNEILDGIVKKLWHKI